MTVSSVVDMMSMKGMTGVSRRHERSCSQSSVVLDYMVDSKSLTLQ